jgi:hypothetical protein
MKKFTCLTIALTLFSITTSFAQLIPFGFVRNCMTYQRTTVTDELTKKHFYLLNRNMETVSNPLMKGATYYSNQSDGDVTNGEIRVLSLIDGSKGITEITFFNGEKNNYTKNFEDVYNQMVNFFKDEKSFKSAKYNTTIKYFFRDKTYYYVYTYNNVPSIVISNYKIEKEYFDRKD